MVTCDLLQLSQYVGSTSIPQLRDHLSQMEVQSVPDQLSLPSLAAGYVKSGDLLAIPLGTMVVSKAINGDTLGLRTLGWVSKVQFFRSLSLRLWDENNTITNYKLQFTIYNSLLTSLCQSDWSSIQARIWKLLQDSYSNLPRILHSHIHQHDRWAGWCVLFVPHLCRYLDFDWHTQIHS